MRRRTGWCAGCARPARVVAEADDPCALPKAMKTPAELAGIRAAHRRDGAALTRFLAWLAAQASARRLERDRRRRAPRRLRAGNEHYRGPSFPTISAAGANGAIVHYRVTPTSNQPLVAGIALPGRFRRAVPRRHHRRHPHDRASASRRRRCGERFTLVLKGHIALAHGALPARHHRLAARRLARAAAVAGRPRLRPRHRPRRRHLPRRARGAAADLQAAQPHRAAAGHGRLQRARLLQGRRLRHPHREPGHGDPPRADRSAPSRNCWDSRR